MVQGVIHGVDRPALAGIFPTLIGKPVVVIDVGATISRSGFCRMKVSTCATCLLLSCCASPIASLTSGCAENSLARNAFCAARYGSALFAWLNATANCFLPPLPAPLPQPASSSAPPRPSATASRPRKRRVETRPATRECLRHGNSEIRYRFMRSVSVPLALHRHRQHDDHRLDHHLHIAVHIVQP